MPLILFADPDHQRTIATLRPGRYVIELNTEGNWTIEPATQGGAPPDPDSQYLRG
jgi:hypothetical protein